MRNRNVRKSCRGNRVRVEINRQRDLIHIVKIEKLLRRSRRTVRLVEANGEKERLVFVSVEEIDRAVRDFIVAK